jgi:hypothetical protein
VSGSGSALLIIDATRGTAHRTAIRPACPDGV